MLELPNFVLPEEADRVNAGRVHSNLLTRGICLQTRFLRPFAAVAGKGQPGPEKSTAAYSHGA